MANLAFRAVTAMTVRQAMRNIHAWAAKSWSCALAAERSAATAAIAWSRITGLETKGDQLDNLDTACKRELLKVMSESFAWDKTVPAGRLISFRKTARRSKAR